MIGNVLVSSTTRKALFGHVGVGVVAALSLSMRQGRVPVIGRFSCCKRSGRTTPKASHFIKCILLFGKSLIYNSL